MSISHFFLYVKIFFDGNQRLTLKKGGTVMYSLSSCPDEQGKVVDSFGAFLVEGARFTSHEEYPIIEERMIATEIPVEIMPFNKALTYRGDLSKTFICTYSPDKTFERIRRNPQRYLDFFKRTAGLIGFDFSIHSDMPIIKQKSQIYDNLSLTYYYGNQNIPVIPNVRSGIDELTPEFLECIPKNSTIAVGTHGFMKETREKYEWYCFLEQVIENLHPKNIIVYGTLSSKIFDDFKKSTNIICYPSWISERWRRVRDGN